MNIVDYQEAAKRTLVELGTEDKNRIHLDSGIVSEIGEVTGIFKAKFAYGKDIDLVNLGEEIADIAWYVVNKARLNGIELSDFTIEEAVKDIQYDKENKGFINLSEEDKNVVFSISLCMHINASLLIPSIGLDHPQAVLMALAVLCNNYEIDFFEQLDKNIKKLKVRFPDKFDADKAINRNTDEERKELEK